MYVCMYIYIYMHMLLYSALCRIREEVSANGAEGEPRAEVVPKKNKCPVQYIANT